MNRILNCLAIRQNPHSDFIFRLDTGYLVRYQAEYRISSQISGRFLDIRPNISVRPDIRPETGNKKVRIFAPSIAFVHSLLSIR